MSILYNYNYDNTYNYIYIYIYIYDYLSSTGFTSSFDSFFNLCLVQ